MILYFAIFAAIWIIPNWWIHKIVFFQDPRIESYDGYGPDDVLPDLLGQCLKVLSSMFLFIFFMRDIAPDSMFSTVSALII